MPLYVLSSSPWTSCRYLSAATTRPALLRTASIFSLAAAQGAAEGVPTFSLTCSALRLAARPISHPSEHPAAGAPPSLSASPS